MLRRTLLVGSAALLVALVAPAAIAQATITPEELLARFERASLIAAQGDAFPSTERMDEVRAALGLPVTLRASWGDVMLPADPVLASLRGTTGAEFGIARAHLAVRAAAAREAFAVQPPDRERVRAVLRDAYRGVQSRPGFFERARDAVIGFIGRAIERIASLEGAAGVLGVLIALLLVVMIALIVRRLGVVPDKRLKGARVHAVQQRIDWHRLADEALARGDMNEAVRLRFRALVEALGVRGVIRPSPSITAGECRSAVADELPAAYDTVARATAIFERAAYAHASMDREDVDVVARAEREVLER